MRLYLRHEVLGPFLDEGDLLGHEPMGVVQEFGRGVTQVAAEDRVVVRFNVPCGTCRTCAEGLHSQCETTQVHEYGNDAALFGYTTGPRCHRPEPRRPR